MAIYLNESILHELRHWRSIAGMLPQSHRGDEHDRRIGLSLLCHYIHILLNIYIYVYVYIIMDISTRMC